MKKYVLLAIGTLMGIVYGISIGKYKVFPYEHLKNFQNMYLESPSIEPDLSGIDVESLISVHPNSSDSIRARLNQLVLGQDSLPHSMPDTIYKITDKAYEDVENLDYIEQFEVHQQYGLNSVGNIFHPEKSNNQLLIYHQGHVGGFIRSKDVMERFINEGFTVYAFSMPLRGKNKQETIPLEKMGNMKTLGSHENFKFLDQPLSIFAKPVIVMTNYAALKNFDAISMCGISGGGWTTTLIAAMDPRINYSFPVSGSYPFFIRFEIAEGRSYGDFEQTYPQLYSQVNYLDMYILGSVGTNRFQTQILNRYEFCCFYGEYSKYYEPVIKTSVAAFDSGDFSVLLDSTHREHKISQFALEEMISQIELASLSKQKGRAIVNSPNPSAVTDD